MPSPFFGNQMGLVDHNQIERIEVARSLVDALDAGDENRRIGVPFLQAG